MTYLSKILPVSSDRALPIPTYAQGTTTLLIRTYSLSCLTHTLYLAPFSLFSFTLSPVVFLSFGGGGVSEEKRSKLVIRLFFFFSVRGLQALQLLPAQTCLLIIRDRGYVRKESQEKGTCGIFKESHTDRYIPTYLLLCDTWETFVSSHCLKPIVYLEFAFYFLF